MKVDAIVVGGGITGLVAAYELQKRGVSYALVEASPRLGGKIGTTFRDGFLLENGPDSFFTQKPWALELVKELGLESELIEANAFKEKVFVCKKSKLVAVPEGFLLMVPTQVWPFLRTPLFSTRAKFRMMRDLIPSPAGGRGQGEGGDESVASFVTRHFGQEALDYLAEPLLCGIYNSDPEKQSLRATFPNFLDLEKKHGSLIWGFLRQKKTKRPGFLSFRQGMGVFVDAIAARLKGPIFVDSGVEFLDKTTKQIRLKNGQPISANTILLTTPANETARLLGQPMPKLRSISSGFVYLAFDQKAFSKSPIGHGIVIPRVEKRPINAITFVSSKFAGRAPDDSILLRVFFGGSRNPKLALESDDAITDMACQNLKEILGVSQKPLFAKVTRFIDGNPQYDVGHLEQIAEIERSLPDGLLIAGSSYRGVGIPDCIREAKSMVAKCAFGQN